MVPPRFVTSPTFSLSHSRRSGVLAFTLLEMLVVIAILAVLTGILFPVVGRMRQSAQATQCSSNLRQLQTATMLYVNEHNGTFPRNRGSLNVTDVAWWQEIFPYCPDPKVFRCLSDNITPTPDLPETWTFNGQAYPNGKVSYGAVGHLDAAKGQDFRAMGKSAVLFSQPSRTLLYTETQHPVMRLSEWWNAASPRWPSEVAFPHDSSTKANFVFMDGHATRMSRDELEKGMADGSLIFNPNN